MPKFITWLRQADKWADHYLVVILIALAGLLLRVPSFFEPIWYGDEAIYLTIGHAMNQGEVLYKDIVDHKTPLIYYLARVDSQTYLRLLTGIGLVSTTICFFFLCQFWFKSKKLSYGATLVFMLLTTLPSLEGPMANGELWVLIFVIPAVLILTRVESIRAYFQHTHAVVGIKDKRDLIKLASAGVLLGLAVMTKVPAVFDLVSAYWLVSLPYLTTSLELRQRQRWPDLVRQLTKLLKQYAWLTLGVVGPFVVTLIIFSLNHALAQYLRYGLLYNFHYAGTWRPEFGSTLMAAWFSLPGKGLTLLGFLGLSLILAQRQRKMAGFVLAWFGLDLFASLLSNRPYPHYLLQLVPVFVLWLLLILANLPAWFKRKLTRSDYYLVAGLLVAGGWLLVSLVMIKFYFYPNVVYFTRFWDRMTGKISREEYTYSFNAVIKDNLAITQFLAQNRVNRLYIWGSNPLLYAQGPFVPATQLITLFHIDDLQAHPATLAQLAENPPPYIVVMKNTPITYAPFATWLNTYYIPNHQFDQATLWKRVSDPMVLGSVKLPRDQSK